MRLQRGLRGSTAKAGAQAATFVSLSLSLVTAATISLSNPSSSLITSTVSASPTLLSSAANATATATPVPDHGPKDGDKSGECNLLGPFSLLVQGALGLLALLSLVWKRYRERPQRPIKIWAFDASKQVVGSVLVHVANLLMSMLSAGQFRVSSAGSESAPSGDYQPNPCSFYLLNLAIDTTIGIPILVGLLRIFTYGFSLTPLGRPPESIRSGNYGDPPKTVWWMKQSIIYFLGLLGMKICVLFIFTLLPWISKIGDWALKWTEGNKTEQVVFVMLLFPLIMNALQYYIIDSFIKEQRPEGHEPIPGHDEDEETNDRQHGETRRRSLGSAQDGSIGDGSSDSELSSGVEENANKEAQVRTRHRASDKAVGSGCSSPHPGEYDPEVDGVKMAPDAHDAH